MVPSVQEFQRNTAFVIFVIVVSFGALLYVLQQMRSLLIPLIWAFFFAIPTLALADFFEMLFIRCMISSTWFCCRPGEAPRSQEVHFRHFPGRNYVQLERGGAAEALVKQVRWRCSRRLMASARPVAREACVWCPTWSAGCRFFTRCLMILLSRLDKSCLSLLWGQRVRIKRIGTLPVMSGSALGRDDIEQEKVNCLVEGASYYISGGERSDDVLLNADPGALELELFLDRQQTYPAILDVGYQDDVAIEGTLEVDERTKLSWLFAMAVTIVVIGVAIWIFVIFFETGIEAVVINVDDYKLGVKEFIDDISNFTERIIPEAQMNKVKIEVQQKMSEYAADLAQLSLLYLESIGSYLFLFVLYLLFWVFEPLPVTEPVAKVFKSYLALKTVVCLLFATVMAAVLWFMECPLWSLYFLITFILNYIPEVGPILAGLLMLPAILFDGGLESKDRYANTTILIIAGVIAKFLTGNVIEVELYSRFGGEFMRIHPVVLFVFFTFCGYQLGVSGMFISIPILAIIKYSLVSYSVPGIYLHPLLTLLEGDVWAPHRNYVERQRCAKTLGEASSTEQSMTTRQDELVELRSSVLGAGA